MNGEKVRFGSRKDMAGMPPGLVDWREGLYLSHLTKNVFEGRGAIVDAGAFLGGSTWAMAKGLSRNLNVSDKSSLIHAFDKFCAWEEPFMSKAQTAEWIKEAFSIDVDDEGRFRDSFLRNVAEFSNLIVTHEGALEDVNWKRGPIEILFVDAGKTLTAWQAILGQFFSALIPGRSIVVHQDWHHAWLPYIIVCQEAFADHFEVLEARINDTASFKLVSELPEKLLRRASTWNFSADEQISLMEKAIARFADLGVEAYLTLAYAELLRNLGRIDNARRVLTRRSPNAGDFANEAQFLRFEENALQIQALL